MSAIRKLAGQTAIYGVPGILGRILGYLLVPLYVRVFHPGEYGVVNVFYAYAAFLNVILTYGMETAFFRFHQQESDREKVYSAGMISLLISSALFILLVTVYSHPIASWIDYADHSEYVRWFCWMLALDALASIPFARLRAENRPIKFAAIKFTGILVNISLNLFFIVLCPYLLKNSGSETINKLVLSVYNPTWSIEYVFVSNLFASGIVLLLLLPEIARTKWNLDKALWRKMFLYAFPLLFAGMAGIINETFDRLLLRYLLPPDIAEYKVGIYSACYKVSILMTIFIQAYRYAAEPFFFAQAREKNPKEAYARIMDYFVITVSAIFLGTMVYLDDFIIAFFLGSYSEGSGVIPILMLANLFLGIYYNLSIWYKLTGKTIWGAWFSTAGAVITLILNFWWIPLSEDHLIHGYYGSAWATFICYGFMMIVSYLVGQKYYPVKYNLKKFFGYLGLSFLLYVTTLLLKPDSRIVSIAFHTSLLFVFGAVVVLVEKPRLSLKKGKLTIS